MTIGPNPVSVAGRKFDPETKVSSFPGWSTPTGWSYVSVYLRRAYDHPDLLVGERSINEQLRLAAPPSMNHRA